MKVIVPCAGKSSRFPDMRPKWMLNHPDGDMMVKKAIDGLNVAPKDVIITILKEHEEKYDIIRGLKENIGEEITVVVLDEQTKSAPETVYLTLKRAEVKESFLVKDSDCAWITPKIEEDFSYVSYSDIQDYEEINPGNKSYIRLNEQNIITEMVEKKVISRFFSLGGYFFKSPESFISSFEKLNAKNNSAELYISHIIEDLIINKKDIFFGKKVDSYFDFGTWEQWSKYRSKFKIYFFDIDGILFQNAAQYFKPRWEDSEPIEENLAIIKKLSANQYNQLFFVTARPEKYRKMTERKLKELGINYSDLIMGCFHAKRIIVNDFSNTTGYPTCEAINILRNSEDLKKYI
jgi:hypothetical protein